MLIDKGHLSAFAGSLLDILAREHLTTVATLQAAIGKVFPITEHTPDFVTIYPSPSNFGTLALTIAYTRPTVGDPLVAKINTALHYSQIILKAKTVIERYKPWAIDPFHNIIQFLVLQTTDLQSLQKELAHLRSLETYHLN